MKLVACTDCHTQYDVSELPPDSPFDCRCGSELRATAPTAAETTVHRCSACGAIAKDTDERCDYCDAGIVRAVDRGSLICPECYARNLDDARFCLGCGVAFDPQSPRSQMPELRCPCCEVWMTAREVGGLEIQECPKCFGLWAPEDRFDALVERAATAAAARAEQPESETLAPRVDGGNPAENRVEYRRCPDCEALMDRRNFQKRSGVIIDRCHQHGTWLDAHELERIAGFVLSGRAARASAAEAQLQAEREKTEARQAAFRMMNGTDERSSVWSDFGQRRDTSTVGTIFDLLSGFLT